MSLFHKSCKQLFWGLLFVFCNVNTLFAQEVALFPQGITPLKRDFYIKPVHPFGFQYNACIVSKAKFTNQNPNPTPGWDPLISYGNEWKKERISNNIPIQVSCRLCKKRERIKEVYFFDFCFKIWLGEEKRVEMGC
jgi:hypothetical protein